MDQGAWLACWAKGGAEGERVMSVHQLPSKSVRHAAEQTLWGLQCDKNALQVLANDGTYFLDLEIQEMREAAYHLIAIADQVTANRKYGSK
jgi:hypothetical protein